LGLHISADIDLKRFVREHVNVARQLRARFCIVSKNDRKAFKSSVKGSLQMDKLFWALVIGFSAVALLLYGVIDEIHKLLDEVGKLHSDMQRIEDELGW
jgi:hypothetical protein